MISTEIPGVRVFEGVSMYLTGHSAVTGRISLCRMIMADALYFSEDSAISPFPFDDCFTLSPVTSSYAFSGGHHIFDLSYYAEITIIEEPARICFHDPAQELGLSLNFKDRASFNDFFDYLKSMITIVSPGLQGFFYVQRFCPPMCDARKLEMKKKKLAKSFNTDSDENCDALNKFHSELLSKLSPKEKQRLTSDKEFEKALSSQMEMKQLIAKYIIPDDRKADAWAFLIGLYPLDNVSEKRMQEYFNIRNQWRCITKSQWERSKLLRDSFSLLQSSINSNKQKLMTVVDDNSVISIVFNVIMSVCQIYSFMHQKHEELIYLIRVFLWMFVQHAEKEKNGIVYYGYRDNLSYNSEELETIIFWSMLYILEKGEIRRQLELPEKDKGLITKQVSDFIFIVHPLLYELLLKKGVKSFDKIAPALITRFSSLLPFCDCTNIWISAAASPNFLEFIQYMVVSCFFINYPNIISLQPQNDQNLMKVIELIFNLIDHYYLESVTFHLMRKSSELIEQSLSDV